MSALCEFEISRLPELYHVDQTWLAQAKADQADLWRGEKPSRPLLTINAELNPEQKLIPNPNYQEAFNDADRMLCSQIRAAARVANAKSAGIPSIRANLGTGICLACIGLEQEVFPDKMPWLQQHLSKDEAAALEPDDIKPRGSFARGLEMMKRFREIMGDSIGVYCMDTQGPFDLAHLMLGDEIFYLVYDDPGLFRHIMEICLEIGIRTHTWMKQICAEKPEKMHHSNALYAENVGIRICEDTTAIVGPDLIEQVIPYSQRLASHFNQAWIHYCGRNDHLTKIVCRIPEFRGLNFGLIPGHEQDHDFNADLKLCRETKTTYWGTIPMLPGEKHEDYLRRLHDWAADGTLIADGNPAIGKQFPDAAAVLDFWFSEPIAG